MYIPREGNGQRKVPLVLLQLMSANKAISDREEASKANKEEAYTHVSYICVQDGLNDR